MGLNQYQTKLVALLGLLILTVFVTGYFAHKSTVVLKETFAEGERTIETVCRGMRPSLVKQFQCGKMAVIPSAAAAASTQMDNRTIKALKKTSAMEIINRDLLFIEDYGMKSEFNKNGDKTSELFKQLEELRINGPYPVYRLNSKNAKSDAEEERIERVHRKINFEIPSFRGKYTPEDAYLIGTFENVQRRIIQKVKNVLEKVRKNIPKKAVIPDHVYVIISQDPLTYDNSDPARPKPIQFTESRIHSLDYRPVNFNMDQAKQANIPQQTRFTVYILFPALTRDMKIVGDVPTTVGCRMKPFVETAFRDGTTPETRSPLAYTRCFGQNTAETPLFCGARNAPFLDKYPNGQPINKLPNGKSFQNVSVLDDKKGNGGVYIDYANVYKINPDTDTLSVLFKGKGKGK